MTGVQELLLLLFVIVALSVTGLWPFVLQALREIRGQNVQHHVPDSADDLCYKILGVSPSSTWDEIEKAYRAKAKIHHPDKGGDEDAMRALNDIYATLKRKQRR